MLIASPDVRRIEIEAMTHISGGRQTNGFRGGPHRFLLALPHLKVASLGQSRLTTLWVRVTNGLLMDCIALRYNASLTLLGMQPIQSRLRGVLKSWRVAVAPSLARPSS